MGDRETAKGSHLDRGIEPSVFETPGVPRPAATPRRSHICPECGSDLVYPTDWAPASERHWQVALRCPECEWNGGGRLQPGRRRPARRGARPRHRGGPRRSRTSWPGRTWRTRSSASSPPSTATNPSRRLLGARSSARRRRRRPASSSWRCSGRRPEVTESAAWRVSTRRGRRARTVSSAPVAAIRSQTLRGAGRVERPQVELSPATGILARGPGSAAGSRCRRADRCRAPCRCARAGR